MAARKKKTEIAEIDETTGEILATYGEIDLEGDAGDKQHFDQDQMVIPRLTILQALSPQIDESSAEHVKGAKPGMIFNTVTRTLHQAITFIPSVFEVRNIAWKPRNQGGGLVDADFPEALMLDESKFQKEHIGKYTGMYQPEPIKGQVQDPHRIEIVVTGEWAGMARNDDGSLIPVAISFPGSKAKIARQMNTKVNTTELPGKTAGHFFQPACYAHAFILTTGTEDGPEGPYWNFIQTWSGFTAGVPENLGMTREYLKAKELREAIKVGDAVVADVTEGEQ